MRHGVLRRFLSTLLAVSSFAIALVRAYPHRSIVKAVQDLAHKFEDLAATVASFAQSFTSRQINTDELCVAKSDGAYVCVTGDQLAALLTK